MNVEELLRESEGRIVAAVAELLRDRAEGPSMLTPAQAAARLGRSPEWVRNHRQELGVVKLGDGPKPRLGVPAERLAAYLACSSGRRTEQAENGSAKHSSKARRPRQKAGRGGLLPIRGEAPPP